jgi:hypothetical protein
MPHCNQAPGHAGRDPIVTPRKLVSPPCRAAQPRQYARPPKSGGTHARGHTRQNNRRRHPFRTPDSRSPRMLHVRPHLLERRSIRRRRPPRHTRFCSILCRNAFDAGFTPYEPDRPRAILNVPLQKWRVIAGPPGSPGTHPYPDAKQMTVSGSGFLIDCLHCKRPFVSKGLRCCCPDHERKLREQEGIAATMAEVGAEPIREPRKCEQCGASIPRWLPGGRGAVPKTRRFCSPSCGKKARRLSAST